MRVKPLLSLSIAMLLTSGVGAPEAHGADEIELLGSKIEADSVGDRTGWSVATSEDGTIIAVGSPQKDVTRFMGVDEAGHVRVYQLVEGTWTQLGSDIVGQDEDENFGVFVDMSSDGSIVAVGAVNRYDKSSSTEKGLVRVYELDEGVWTQLGSDIVGEEVDDRFGLSLSLNGAGSRLAIGAPLNDGNGTDSGSVRVFEWDSDSTEWSQLGSDLDGEAAGDESGQSVSLSSDGSTLAVGAPRNDGAALNAGHVRVYRWNETTWNQIGSDIDGAELSDYLGGIPSYYSDTTYAVTGQAVSLSSDGSILSVGVIGHDTGGKFSVGTVKVFEYENTEWNQLGSNIDGTASTESGNSVSLSSNGERLAIGTRNDPDASEQIGSIRLFEFDSETSGWVQVGQEITGDADEDQFGFSVRLSGDGQNIIGGAPGTASRKGYVKVSRAEITTPQNQSNPAPSAPAPYSGPLVKQVGPTPGLASVFANEAVTVHGERLSTVSKVFVDGLEGEVISTSADSFVMTVPEGVSAGTYDLVIESSLGNLTYLDALVITPSVGANCSGESMSYWTARISDSQAKVYIKCPGLDAKIRILHQTGGSGEYDVPFVKTITSLDDSSLVVNEFGTYIVRTIDLDEINRIRIRVDDQEVWKVRYNNPPTGVVSY